MKKITYMFLMLAISGGTVLGQQSAIQFATQIIPAAYDPSLQIPQFADVCADMTLPAGHVYVKPPTKQGWTTTQVMAKGVTHWIWGMSGDDNYYNSNPAYNKKRYNNVPQIRGIFGLPGPDANGNWWPNGFYDESQARAKGQQADITPRLWVGETMEGADWVPDNEPMWGWFYDELITRYENQKAQDGVPYYVAHNYFSRWPTVFNVGQDTRANHEALYSTSWSNWPATMYTPGQTIGRPNTILEGVYMNVPDLIPQTIMGMLMHMELAQKMGKYTGLFVFNVHEWMPGFASRVNYPGEGTFYRSDKMPLDPNIQIALAFLSQEYGNIWVEWGLNPFQPASRKPIDYYNVIHDGKDFWYPAGQTTPANPCPFYDQDNGQPTYGGGLAYLGDMPHFGMVLWNSTGGQVAGGTAYYATYKIDGGNWINRQANGSDVVGAYFEQRGLARVRILGNKMLIVYFNFFADNASHTIEVQNPLNPGQTFVGTVCGNGVHAVVVTIN
jgi:hypothetical protein